MKDGQSKRQSFIEAIINSILGYIVAILSQYLIFPMYGVHLPFYSHLEMGLFFTIISILRSFILRRIFNLIQLRTSNVNDAQTMETIT